MRTLDYLWENQGVAAVLVMHHIDYAQQQVLHQIVDAEWAFFDEVEGLNGRAGCQDNAVHFALMRLAQHAVFSPETRAAILRDLTDMRLESRNPITEKYARMMEKTDPELFASMWADKLPPSSPVRKALLKQVHNELFDMYTAALQRYPQAASHGRPTLSKSAEVSAFDYLTAELASYSYATLRRVLDDLQAAHQSFVHEHSTNLIEEIWRLTVELSRALDA